MNGTLVEDLQETQAEVRSLRAQLAEVQADLARAVLLHNEACEVRRWSTKQGFGPEAQCSCPHRLAEAEAQCAAMREALRDAIDSYPHEATCTEPCGHCSRLAAMAVALNSSTAGRDFEARVRAQERERCAKVAVTAEATAYVDCDDRAYQVARYIAAAIRALGDE